MPLQVFVARQMGGVQLRWLVLAWVLLGCSCRASEGTAAAARSGAAGPQLLAESVQFHSTFTKGSPLLPFGRAKRNQYKRALLVALNLPAYTADKIRLGRTAAATQGPNFSVTLLTTLDPAPGVTAAQLAAAVGQLPLFFRGGSPAMRRWFKGATWRLSTAQGVGTSPAITLLVPQPGCRVDLCLLMDGSSDAASWASQTALVRELVGAIGAGGSNVAVVRYAATADTSVVATTVGEATAAGSSFTATVLAAGAPGGGRDLPAGIATCKDALLAFGSGNAMRMVVISNPASPDASDPAPAIAAAQLAKIAGVEILAVGVRRKASPSMLRSIASTPGKAVIQAALGPAKIQVATDALAPKLCSPGECQMRSAPLQVNSAATSGAQNSRARIQIVNGEPAAFGEFPFVARVLITNETGRAKYLCSASLIKPTVLLLAAHCLLDEAVRDPSNVWGVQLLFLNKTTVGLTNRFCPGNAPVRTASVKSIPHPSYNPASYSYDVALLVLAEPITTIQPIQLAPKGLSIADGDTLNVAGWGVTAPVNANVSDGLMHTTVVKGCPSGLLSSIPVGAICIRLGPGNSATCFGDSGGPSFIYDANGQPIQVGVTSTTFKTSGQGFCEGYSAYTSVAYYRDWIDAQLAALGY